MKVLIIILLVTLSLSAQENPELLIYTSENSPLPSNKIYCITVDTNNKKWIGTDNGLASFDGVNWEVFNTNNGLVNNVIVAIAIDKNNNVWIIDSVLSVYNGNNWKHFTSDKYENASIKSKTLAIDGDNIKWMTSRIERGATAVCSFNDTVFTIFDWGLTNVDLRSVWKIKTYKHIKWIADFYTLWKYDNEKFSKIKLGRVDDFDVSNKGTVLLSTEYTIGNPDESIPYFKHYKVFDTSQYSEITGLPFGAAYAVSFETDSIKWFGIDYSIYKVTDVPVDSFRNGFDINKPGIIEVDKSGNKWIASHYEWYYSGVLVYKKGGVILTSIPKDEKVLQSFYLKQNYPNPFNSTTVINYFLSKNSEVELMIYDTSGKYIETLINESQSAGEHSITFTSEDLASGIYIYKIKTNSFEQSRKMLLLK